MSKRVLITGANGAIGKECVKLLAEGKTDYSIRCLVHNKQRTKKRIGRYSNILELIEGDLTKPETLEKLTKEVDFVIHLAAVIPPIAHKNPKLAYNVNVGGTKNLIEALEKNSPNAFLLFASSITVYGDRLNTPNIKVGDKLKESLNDGYGKAKIEAEKLIQQSKINWTIFRLTGIIDPKLNKPDPLMFHMPLNTNLEICTTLDCARAFVNSLEHQKELSHKIFNLGGGSTCQVVFKDFLAEAFERSGLGPLNFPNGAFATANFHCGFYSDSDLLNNIVGFQKETLQDYYTQMEAAIPAWQKFFAKLFSPVIKQAMLKSSKPYKAFKTKNAEGIKQFFTSQNR